ncbi:MAG: hypothetical protein Q9212_000008 [Teloschistes hypoglaucus]
MPIASASTESCEPIADTKAANDDQILGFTQDSCCELRLGTYADDVDITGLIISRGLGQISQLLGITQPNPMYQLILWQGSLNKIDLITLSSQDGSASLIDIFEE